MRENLGNYANSKLNPDLVIFAGAEKCCDDQVLSGGGRMSIAKCLVHFRMKLVCVLSGTSPQSRPWSSCSSSSKVREPALRHDLTEAFPTHATSGDAEPDPAGQLKRSLEASRWRRFLRAPLQCPSWDSDLTTCTCDQVIWQYQRPHGHCKVLSASSNETRPCVIWRNAAIRRQEA